MLHIRHRIHLSKITKLGIAGVFISLGAAFIDTIWSIYLFSFFQSEAAVGFISSLFTGVMFVTSLLMIPLIEKMDESKAFKYIIFANSLVYIGFAVSKSIWFVIVITLINVTLINMRKASYGILIRDESRIKDIGKNESLIYNFINISYVIGPLISGIIAQKYSISFIFVLAAIFFMITSIMLSFMHFKKSHIPKKLHMNPIKNFFSYFKNKNRRSAYILACGIRLWWSFIYVFMPMEILRRGYDIAFVGFFLTLIAIPLIIFEYQAGKYVDKMGHKIFFILGYLAMTMLTLTLVFIQPLMLILALAFIASFIMAVLEPMQDSYFFKTIKKKDEDVYYPVFLTTSSLGSTISKVLIAGVLLILPFNFTFLLISLIMFLMFTVSLNVKPNL